MAHLIDQLFTSDEDRTFARAWAAKLDADGVGDRSKALMREAAATSKRGGTEMTPAQAREYMADFARTIGMLDHQINSSIAWLDSQSAPSADPAAPSAAPDNAEIERRIARQDADRFEKMMRENPREYWGSAENQQPTLIGSTNPDGWITAGSSTLSSLHFF